MLKSAQYFLLIFTIVTVIPLVLMLSWTNSRIDRVMQLHAMDFAQIGKKEISISLDNYVQKLEGNILIDTSEVDFRKASLADLQKILAPREVSIVRSKGLKKIISYFELNNKPGEGKLLCVVEIPFGTSSDKILRVAQEVDFLQFNQHGPFQFELYSGDEISQKSFLGRLNTFDMPPHPHFEGGFAPPPHPFEEENDFVFQQKSPKYSSLPLYGENAQVVATLAVQSVKKPMPPEARLFENNFGLFIFFVGLGLSFFFAFYLQKNFIKPLLQLSLASKRVQKGDFNIELNADGAQKEIKRTFANFNQMCDDLKEKEQLRNSFIVNLTHDLRTPLLAQERSLSLFSQCFEKLGLKDEMDLAQSLENNSRHLLRMVNLILESYRFDSRQVELVYCEIDLRGLVEESFAKLKVLASEKSTIMQNEVEQGFKLYADEVSMGRILSNLLSNSIENISKNGFIKVSAKKENGFAQIVVEDNGCGIAQGDLEHIFDRYYSGKTLDRKLGSGLGLDVCKKLVELHNGTILVESEIDIYTRFTIKIPLKETL